MNTVIATRRASWQGMSEIVAFNRHWYFAGLIGIACGVALMIFVPLAQLVRIVGWFGIGGAVLWSAASLIVSHWVYDRSILRDWVWVRETLSRPPLTWSQIHCGLDESSPALRELLPTAAGTILDIFDQAEMTEPSIARARSINPTSAALRTDFRNLALADRSLDAVFLLFAAHELRRREARIALLTEVHRVLRDGGEVIFAEHLRDFANFCAFGPGAFHFFSRREWRRVFTAADLVVHREFTITPFVRVFVLRRAL